VPFARGVTLTIPVAASSLSGMAPPSPGPRLMCRLVVLFAVATLLGHVCGLEPDHHHLADASAWIGSAGPDSGGPVTIDEASCDSVKPTTVWPVIRPIDSQPLHVADLVVPGSARAGWAPNVPVPCLRLFVLHAALLI
jgi:hypothetical protein